MDEVTDITVTSQFLSFIQYFDFNSLKVRCEFLEIQDVLSESESANSEALLNLIEASLQKNDLSWNKFAVFTINGAAIMTGKMNGLGAKLRAINPSIICIHCICHKLALLCSDSNTYVSYLNSVMGTLRSLWKYFEDSPKRTIKYIKVTANTKNFDVSDNRVKQLVTTK